MNQVDDNYYDLAICDPEYGLSMGGSLNVNSKTKFKTKEWDSDRVDKRSLKEVLRISNNQVFWGYNYYSDLLPPCKGFIYWNKMNHHENRSDGELAWTSFDKLSRHFEYMWDGNRYGFKNGKINGVGQSTIRIHPTEKPQSLYKWLLKNYAEPNQKIFDGWGGSMSIAIACWDLGFDLDIIELDTDYFNDAVQRFETHISQTQLF